MGEKFSRSYNYIHSGVCGPFPTELIGGQKYLWHSLIITQGDVLSTNPKSSRSSRSMKLESCMNDNGQPIGTLWSDNGGEGVQMLPEAKGIRHEMTIPYSPEQNGVEWTKFSWSQLGLWLLMPAYPTPIGQRLWPVQPTLGTEFQQQQSQVARYCTKYGMGNNRCKQPGSVWLHCLCTRTRCSKNKKSLVQYSNESEGYGFLEEKSSKVFIRRDVIFNETKRWHSTRSMSCKLDWGAKSIKQALSSEEWKLAADSEYKSESNMGPCGTARWQETVWV